jgi:hypothetical protein
MVELLPFYLENLSDPSFQGNPTLQATHWK